MATSADCTTLDPLPDAESIHVLLVEDNAGDARLVEETIRESGCGHVCLTHTDRLSAAMECLESKAVDAVLLDLALPDGQGLDGVIQIQKSYPRLPIVVLSGGQDESLAVKALEQGAQDYLKKGEADGRGLVRAVRYAIERQRVEDRLTYLATHDPLTGLANRMLLHDRLEHAVDRARRSDQAVHALYLDLDGFKPINDSCGHTVGDHLLRSVAERLRACIRRADTVARIGGDEFVVVLESTAHVKDTDAIAQKIVDTIARPFEIHGRRITVTASIGLAGFPQDGETVDQLVRHADAAMYMAKQGGGHRICWFSPQNRHTRKVPTSLCLDFRKALERHELVVYYQPQLNLRTNTVASVEALLRWNHPAAGLVLPSVFIPFAEHSGQMAAVGEFLLQTAAAQYHRWKKASVWSFRLCVNLFARQLASEHGAAEFVKAIERTGLGPADVAVDLPGLPVGDDCERERAILSALQRQGIQIALDNVGTNAWSFDALRRLPWDAVKIDSSLVQGGVQGTEEAAMVRMLVGLGSDLGRRVVAEGVADLAQLKFLRAVGCTDAMGYFICPPLPEREMTAWLRERNCPATAAA